MISLDKKFIFIHINKTAGTSIKQALQPNRVAPSAIFQDDNEVDSNLEAILDVYKHPHWMYDEYKRYFGSSFRDFFKFSVVRNPWDRAVSFYSMKPWTRSKS